MCSGGEIASLSPFDAVSEKRDRDVLHRMITCEYLRSAETFLYQTIAIETILPPRGLESSVQFSKIKN